MANDHSMNSNEWKIFNRDKKLFNQMQQNRYYCKCGHSVLITNKQEKAFCDWCKHWVYKDKDKQLEYDKKAQEQDNRVKKIKFKKELLKRL